MFIRKSQYNNQQFPAMLLASEPSPPLSTAPALSESSKQLCNSSASSKCQSESILHAQIAQLKQKAHQSFMQVMQMQQLHEEQLEMLRGEQALRENQWLLRVQELEERVARSEELELRVQQLENENSAIERNYKLHFIDLEDDELSIDSIDIITAAQKDSQDDDNHAHLKEVLQSFEKQLDFQKIREDLINQVKNVVEGLSCIPEESSLFELVNKTLNYVTSVRMEWTNFLQRQRQKEIQLTKQAVSNKGYEALQRESQFMAEHIKRLSTEKLRAQKRAAQAQRQLRVLQEKITKIEGSFDKRGIILSQLPKHKSPGVLRHDHSMQLQEFVSQNLKNSTSSNPHASVRSNPHQFLIKTNKR